MSRCCIVCLVLVEIGLGPRSNIDRLNIAAMVVRVHILLQLEVLLPRHVDHRHTDHEQNMDLEGCTDLGVMLGQTLVLFRVCSFVLALAIHISLGLLDH